MKYKNVSEIGPIRPVKNPDRREACRLDLDLFMREYFPDAVYKFKLQSHVRWFQQGLLQGGQYGVSAPRCSGTTTRVMLSTIWAHLYGHRRFTLLLVSERAAVRDLLHGILDRIAENPMMVDDFPEVEQPLAAIEGIIQRCRSQTVDGVPTDIDLGRDSFVFPTIKGSRASNSNILVRSVRSSLLGITHQYCGKRIRPDAVIADSVFSTEVLSSVSMSKRVTETLDKLRHDGFRFNDRFAWIDCVSFDRD